MKLLFISNLYPPLSIGGYEESCFDVAQLLKANGHQVVVLTSAFRAAQAPTHEDGVHRRLKVVWNWGLPETGPMPWLARHRFDAEWHNARTVQRLCSELDPDAVVFWNGAGMGRALLSSCGSRPVLFYLFDIWLAPLLAAQRREIPMGKRLYRALLSRVGLPVRPLRTEGVLFCSRALRSQYEEMGVETSGSTVIYPGVPGEIFSPADAHILRRARGEPFRILYSGRVAPEKGVTTLVKALREVRRVAGLEDTRLTVNGPLQYEGYIAELGWLIQTLGLEGAIDFLPHRSRQELPPVLAEHDVLVFPSEWREPFGLSLLEAMAVGLPVLTTLRGGPAEFVRDGENARVFAAGDPGDLAAKLTSMLSRPVETAALGKVASAQVRQRHTLEAQTRSLEAILQSDSRIPISLAQAG